MLSKVLRQWRQVYFTAALAASAPAWISRCRRRLFLRVKNLMENLIPEG